MTEVAETKTLPDGDAVATHCDECGRSVDEIRIEENAPALTLAKYTGTSPAGEATSSLCPDCLAEINVPETNALWEAKWGVQGTEPLPAPNVDAMGKPLADPIAMLDAGVSDQELDEAGELGVDDLGEDEDDEGDVTCGECGVTLEKLQERHPESEIDEGVFNGIWVGDKRVEVCPDCLSRLDADRYKRIFGTDDDKAQYPLIHMPVPSIESASKRVLRIVEMLVSVAPQLKPTLAAAKVAMQYNPTVKKLQENRLGLHGGLVGIGDLLEELSDPRNKEAIATLIELMKG